MGGLDLLWEYYASPLFQGGLDLWADARNDDELRAHLIALEKVLDRETLELTRRLFPRSLRPRDFEGLVQHALATARGLALLDTLDPDGDRNRKQWVFCRPRLAEMFAAAEGRPLTAAVIPVHRETSAWRLSHKPGPGHATCGRAHRRSLHRNDHCREGGAPGKGPDRTLSRCTPRRWRSGVLERVRRPSRARVSTTSDHYNRAG